MVVEERGEKTEETESKRENGVEKDQNLEGKSYLGEKKKKGGLNKTLDDGGDIS